MAVFDPDLQPSSDRGHLLTEQSNWRSSRLDQLDTLARWSCLQTRIVAPRKLSPRWPRR